MYYSVDEKNGLKYTVGVKSLGLLSTTIDKASGGILKGEEVQLKCSPEYAEGATIDSTLQVAEKHDEKAISDKTTTERVESENVAAKTNSQPRRSSRSRWIQVSCRRASEQRKAHPNRRHTWAHHNMVSM